MSTQWMVKCDESNPKYYRQYCKGLSLSEIWTTMEHLKAEGLCHSIGVSNFREEHIKEIESTWKTPPSVNQVSIYLG